jgi:hypothetical protein
LLGACEKHSNVSVGKWAADQLLECCPTYMLLPECGGEVEMVRTMMSERKDTKFPACSL